MAESRTTFYLELLFSFLLLICSAKLHGRHLRLLREIQGVTDPSVLSVHFGDAGRRHNAAWVESLWRADRVRFWLMFPTFACAFLLYLGLSSADNLPPLAANSPSLPPTGLMIIAALFWSSSLALICNTCVSAAQVSSLATEVQRALAARGPDTAAAASDNAPTHGTAAFQRDEDASGSAPASPRGSEGSGSSGGFAATPLGMPIKLPIKHLVFWWAVVVALVAIVVGLLFAA